MKMYCHGSRISITHKAMAKYEDDSACRKHIILCIMNTMMSTLLASLYLYNYIFKDNNERHDIIELPS